MIGLDLKTLFTAATIHYLVILAVIVPFWLKQRKRYRGLDFLMVCSFLLAAGQLTLMSRESVHPLFSIVGGNILVLGGSVFYLAGLGKFVNKRWLIFPSIILVAVAAGLVACFTFLVDNLAVRTVAASVAYAAVASQCAFLLLVRTDTSLRRVALLPAIVLTLFGVVAISRVVFALFFPGAAGFLRAPAAEIAHLLLFEILGTALLVTTVLMIANRLCAELEAVDRRREGRLHELEHLAMVDSLTGVYNRLKLEQVLETEIQRSHRFARPLSVIILNVDHYKLINDSFGHTVGDAVLKAISTEMRGNVRKVDVVGRWGGDEFLIISPETVLFGAANLAETLRKRIEKYQFETTGPRTVSFGVAELKNSEQAGGLLKRADDALYRAKQFGRNKVMWAG